MPSALKTEQLDELKTLLKERSSFVVTTYTGLKVEEMVELRSQIRSKDARLKVIKNRLFHLALKDSPDHTGSADGLRGDLKGPVAVTFTGGSEFPEVAKLLVEYSKKNDKVKIKSGMMDGSLLNSADVNAIATLPSREELLAVIGRGLNTPATKIAIGMKEVIQSLARGIKAVGEKNG